MAQAYSIYETKARFSELLRHVKQGKDLVVTERGKPIAKLVPYRETGSVKQRLEELKAGGSLLPRKNRKIGSIARIHGGLKRFLEDRE